MIGLLPMSEDITKQKDVTERLSSGKGLYLKQNLQISQTPIHNFSM